MEVVYIDKNKFRKFKKLTTEAHDESDIYIDKDTLIKRIKGDLMNQERENVIRYISSLDENKYAIPLYGISTTKDKKINGYAMRFFKEYQTISDYLLTHSLTFKEKIDLCNKVCSMIRELENIKVYYYDIRPQNFLTNGNDTKLIDMDGVIIDGVTSNDCSVSETLRLIEDRLRYLCSVILIGNEDIIYYAKNANIKYLLENTRRELVPFMDKVFYFDKEIDNPMCTEESLTYFTEDYISDAVEILTL